MGPAASKVHCEVHGPQQETFVCQHIVQSLRDRRPVGFFCARGSESTRPNAWCASCNELVRQAGGEWTPEVLVIAGVKLLCGACYDEAKALNLGIR